MMDSVPPDVMVPHTVATPSAPPPSSAAVICTTSRSMRGTEGKQSPCSGLVSAYMAYASLSRFRWFSPDMYLPGFSATSQSTEPGRRVRVHTYPIPVSQRLCRL